MIWNAPHIRSQIETVAHTTAGIYKINQKHLEAFVVPLPPIVEQQRVVEEADRQLSIVAAAETAIGANLARAERLRQAILKRAFEGRLVPQDPHDEPASALLARIRAQRAKGKPSSRSTRTNQMRLPGVS
jgi:type I restriction enzyme S subunit